MQRIADRVLGVPTGDVGLVELMSTFDRLVSPRRLGTIVVGLAIATVAVAIAIRSFGSVDRVEKRSTREPSATPGPTVWAGLRSGWNELPAPPAVHASSATTWTGNELLLWGGNERDGARHFADGYAFDAETSSWHPIAPSPLAARSWPAAVWTGNEFLIWGGSSGSWPADPDGVLLDGAAYNPQTDAWRPIAPAPITNVPMVSVWSGKEMLVWGSLRDDASGPGAAYDPIADSWRELPPSPTPINDGNAVWTGSEMVVFGAELRGGNHSTTDFAVGVAYDPSADSWRSLPPSELSPQASSVAWDGKRVIAADYGDIAASLGTDRWNLLPRLPINQCEDYPQLASTEGTTYARFCGELASLVGGSDRWHVIEGRGPLGGLGRDGVFGQLIPADGALLVLGDYPDPQRLRAYLPTPSQAGTSDADATDVAAAFAAVRSHYPFGGGRVPNWATNEISSVLSPTGEQAWADGGELRALWAYYTGFEIRDVKPMGNDRFEVTIALWLSSGDESYRETLVLAPGDGLDGDRHDLVIVDARPG